MKGGLQLALLLVACTADRSPSPPPAPGKAPAAAAPTAPAPPAADVSRAPRALFATPEEMARLFEPGTAAEMTAALRRELSTLPARWAKARVLGLKVRREVDVAPREGLMARTRLAEIGVRIAAAGKEETVRLPFVKVAERWRALPRAALRFVTEDGTPEAAARAVWEDARPLYPTADQLRWLFVPKVAKRFTTQLRAAAVAMSGRPKEAKVKVLKTTLERQAAVEARRGFLRRPVFLARVRVRLRMGGRTRDDRMALVRLAGHWRALPRAALRLLKP